jgi:hypothetical protein
VIYIQPSSCFKICPMSYILVLAAASLAAISLLGWRTIRGRGRWFKFAGVVGIVACVLMSAGLSLSFLFAHFMCGKYVMSREISPDDAVSARVTEFDCGATTSFTSYVELRSTRSIIGHLGMGWSTVFTIEDDPRLVSIRWTGQRELTIRHPQNSELFQCDSTWNDVHIKCDAYTPDLREPLTPLPEPARWCW